MGLDIALVLVIKSSCFTISSDCVSEDKQGRPSASLSHFQMNFKHACIFIDGENLRHSLVELFGADFNPTDYLPKRADWDEFFGYLVKEASAELRLRTYWYVVDEIDFWPYDISRLLKRRDFTTLDRIIRQHRPNVAVLDALPSQSARQTKLEEIAIGLTKTESAMKRRFEGWQQIQNGIAHRFDSVEFRRAGSIQMRLFTQKFGQEKGVDVKLATDVLKLNDIYDVGIIVSGDGDYVPAVQVVKDWGKHIINVSFLKKSGGLLPGGARRLNQTTDRAIEVAYNDMKKFMKVPTSQPASVAAASAAPVAVTPGTKTTS
jgi:uncharacterized LabA/DUF88 family protein